MVIDFHAHVLPGADHGSDSVKTSLRQMRMAEDAGVDLIVATPHFYGHHMDVRDFAARRRHCARKLMAEYTGGVRLKLGAEVLVCSGINRMDGLEQLCVEGTDVLLLEMPFSEWTQDTVETVYELIDDGRFRVVMAHIDRYAPVQVNKLLEYGAKAQLNAEAFKGLFSASKFKHCIDCGDVVALGSDIHGTDVGYSEFQKARKRLGDRFDLIMDRTAELIGERI